MRLELTRRRIRLQSSDDSGLSNLIRARILEIDRRQQQDVTLLRNARGDRLHDLAIDRLFIVCDEVLVEKFLDLVG